MNSFEIEHKKSEQPEQISKGRINTTMQNDYFSSKKIFDDIEEVLSETENIDENGNDDYINVEHLATTSFSNVMQSSYMQGLDINNLTVSEIPSAPKEGYKGTISQHIKNELSKHKLSTQKIEDKMVGSSEESQQEILKNQDWKSRKNANTASSGLISKSAFHQPFSSQGSMTYRTKHKNNDADYYAADSDDDKKDDDNPCHKVMQDLTAGIKSCTIL